MASKIERVGISIPHDLLKAFDEYVAEKGYSNRSEAIRDLMREALNEENISSDKDAIIVGTLTMIYNHHVRTLTEDITELQHKYHHCILANTHIHLDHDNCLEVVLLRGTVRDIERITGALVAMKGVKLGKVVMFEKDIP